MSCVNFFDIECSCDHFGAYKSCIGTIWFFYLAFMIDGSNFAGIECGLNVLDSFGYSSFLNYFVIAGKKVDCACVVCPNLVCSLFIVYALMPAFVFLRFFLPDFPTESGMELGLRARLLALRS